MTEFDDDPELPDPSDMDQDDDETEPCPYCRKMIHYEAEFCHHCGKYLSREDAPRPTPNWIIIAGLVVLIASLILWLI